MKLKELAIDGAGIGPPLRVGRFSDGLTLVYGEKGAGKTTARHFIRETVLGIQELYQSESARGGQLNLSWETEEFQLNRPSGSATVELCSLSNVVSEDSIGTESLGVLKSRLNPELYQAVFNVSLQDTPTNFHRLCSVLHHQLGVPSGPGSAGDETEYLRWQRETTGLKDQVEAMRARLDALNQEKSACLRQIELSEQARQAKISEIEVQTNQIAVRISEIQAISFHDQLAALEREIAQRRSGIANAKSAGSFVKMETSAVADRSMYQRLDDLEDQIRQWRKIQAGVQNQRVRLRDEMLVWNELTLKSEQHPYHAAHSILVSLESRIDESERHAQHWSEADVARVDTSQLAETHSEICRRMRSDVQGLGDELSQQYKHMRHRTTAAELRHLRGCYQDLGDNIDRLMERRQVVIREIGSVDPAGADAIERAEARFCQCAQREGYFEARNQFVGRMTHPNVQPNYQATNMPAENLQLAALERQRLELITASGQHDSELALLSKRHAELVRERNQILGEPGWADLEIKTKNVDAQILALTAEMNLPLVQLENLSAFIPAQPSELIIRACDLLTRFSDGDLRQVFLGDDCLASHGAKQFELQVRDRHGKVLNASAVDAGLQDQVYLSLLFAAKESLEAQGLHHPIILDDAFSRIPPERVTKTLGLLNELGDQGHQVIALTQHRYLADRIPGVALLELSSERPAIQSFSSPEWQLSQIPQPSAFSPIEPQADKPSSLKSTAFTAPTVPLRESSWHSTRRSVASLPRPYPLSKYPPNAENSPGKFPEYSVGFPATGIVVESTSPQSTVSSVSVDKFAQQLGYVTAITEATPLRKVGLFDARELREFENHRVETVGELLRVDWSTGSSFGFLAEQLDRWKGQLALMVTVPGLRIVDAKILVACGITEPEHLDTSHPEQLFERVQRFLVTTEGRRFSKSKKSISLARIGGWYRALDATRSHWTNRTASNHLQSGPSQDAGLNHASQSDLERSLLESGPRIYDQAPSVDEERRSNFTEGGGKRESDQVNRTPRASKIGQSVREPRPVRSPRMKTPIPDRTKSTRPKRKIIPRLDPAGLASNRRKPKVNNEIAKPGQAKLKFYLDLSDHIEAAPSIGPKTAERFEKISVCTVSDFLKQTADSMATKLNYKRISAETIRNWQHQARLICRVPNLRGHDAQLLVACGLTEPEELSTMQPQSLFEVVGPFSETKDGMKIIRNGKKPDLAEITDWISWAEHTRSLQAA